MLSSLETNDLAQAFDLLHRELVALQESPVLCNCPSWALDLSSIPLNKLFCGLDIFSNWLFRENIFSSQQCSLDEALLVSNRKPAKY
jgi:hypothetical protein